jgi:hypothetical protein
MSVRLTDKQGRQVSPAVRWSAAPRQKAPFNIHARVSPKWWTLTVIVLSHLMCGS